MLTIMVYDIISCKDLKFLVLKTAHLQKICAI